MLPAEQHEGLLTLADRRLDGILDNKNTRAPPAGGYYLIDSRGNPVMYVRPEIEPRG